MNVFELLAAPFSPDQVHFRVGSTNKKSQERTTGDKNAPATKGMALAYIDARDVMERLDSVVTPVNWQRTYSHAATKTICDLSIRIDGEWISKADGAGDSDIEAEKGAISDAFKRAAVNWGIGRYLYDVPSIWVEIDKFGQIEKSELPKLHALLAKNSSGMKSETPSVPTPEEKALRTRAEQNMSRIRTTLAALDTDQQFEWVRDERNAKDIETVRWFKNNMPDLYQEIAGTGFEV